MNRKIIVAIDFDGTIATEVYPGCGELIPGARETINWLKDLGHTIIINTCREDEHAEVAKKFLTENNIPWDIFNENSQVKIDIYGNDCRKISCDVCIDDKSIWSLANGKNVDWGVVRGLFEKMFSPQQKIICIVGESGVGKTHLAEYLDNKWGIPMIESRTTRAPRYEGEKGHTFVSDEEFDSYDKNDMLAFTEFGGKRYCCLSGDVSADITTYVIDEFGLQYLKEHFSHKYSIFAVRIYAVDSEIKKRVSQERIDRDKGKFTLSADHFDYLLENDYSEKMVDKYYDLYKKIKG
jgi:guanylate kinase